MTRREARELIMKMLFEVTFHTEEDRKEIFDTYTVDLKGKIKNFIEEVYFGVLDHQEEINKILGESSQNWSIQRMAKIDYVLLSMGIYELKWCEDVPAKVSINEMIEIAKVYSCDKSPKFINGILGDVLKKIEG